MLMKKLTLVLLTFGILGVAGAVLAEDDAAKPKEKGFFERLDNFGKSIFGGILPGDSSKKKEKDAIVAPKPESKTGVRKPSLDASADEVDVPKAANRRAGSILTGPEAQERVSSSDANASTVDSTPTSDVMSAPPGQTTTAKSSRVGANLIQDVPSANSAIPRIPDEPAPAVPAAQSASRPLHERLAAARESVFTNNESPAETNSKPIAPSDRASEPPQPSPAAPALVAQRTKPENDVAEPVIDPMAKTSPAKDDKAASPPIENKSPQPQTTSTPVAVEKTPEARTDADGSLLVARKGPVLSVETLGPRRIAVGKESTYEVVLTNSGEVAGEDLIVYVSLPEWAEVVGAQASTGAAQAVSSETTDRSVQWKLGRLNANGRERLSLRIIPRQSKPFDLAVRWQYKPVASQAMIEVQEPKLALQLEGPRDVLFGKKEVYRLKLANTGNGAADNVVIMLMPIGGGENVPATHRIGGLAAGAEKTLDVELTARQAGHLTIQVDARAEGGVHAELSERVFVRRADLKLEVEGPKMQFVGVTTSYAVRVRNPGTATAKNLNISIVLPSGMKYLSGVDDAKLDQSGKLCWKLASLKPDAEQTYLLKCSLGAAGASRVTATIAADDELTATADMTTQIDAVANLTMDVKNPEGPVAVGDEATYEVRIRNRGTRAADGVEVFAYFSRGIEPTTAEGGPNRIEPGQVIFQPVTTLAPGAEMVFSIRARAEVAGTHVFRAETHCKPLSSRLICETNNLYYADASVAQQTSPESHNAGQRLRDAMRPIPHALPSE
ncbi:MAG: hypothetical protein ABFC77_14890 [Thermoguttaceae bacterium]